MREQTAQAIYDGEVAHTNGDRERAQEAMHKAFESQAAGIESDNRLMNQIKPGVRDMIGVKPVERNTGESGDGGGGEGLDGEDGGTPLSSPSPSSSS